MPGRFPGLAILLIWAALAPADAVSQVRSEAMRDAFGLVPQTVLTIENGTGEHVSFHSPEAARAVGRGFDDDRIGPGVATLGMTGPGPMVQYLMVEDEGGWPTRIGFAPLNLRHMVSIVARPSVAYSMALTPMAGQRAEAVLLANGYEMSTGPQGTPFLRRGGEDFALDMLSRDVADPFGGHLGQASRVGIVGDILTYSNATPLLLNLLQPQGPTLMDHPEIRRLLAAVDGAPLGAGQVMQAVVLSDPTLFVPRPLGDDPTVELPDIAVLGPWVMGMLLEVSDGTTDMAMFALSFVSEDDAAKAAAALPDTLGAYVSLRTARPLLLDLPAAPDVAVSTLEPRVLLITLAAPYDISQRELMRITNFRRMQQLIYAGDAGFLRPM